MHTHSIYNNMVRGDDGAWSTAYGPFVLKSALQPVFRRLSDSVFDIHSFQGLVRADRNGEPLTPAQFFPLVDPSDLPEIESLLRSIHILNTGLLHRSRALAFVSFNPSLYPDPARMRLEFDRIRLAGHEAGIEPRRIICDISGAIAIDPNELARNVERLRQAGFRISLSDYGADDTDVERVRTLRPDFVRLDGDWVRDYLDNAAGFALLKVIVRQLSDTGTETIFDRLEEMWQVDLCQDFGVSLLQGYALARPEIAPTSFNERFPEMLLPLAPERTGTVFAGVAAPETRPLDSGPPDSTHPRRTRTFGKRSG